MILFHTGTIMITLFIFIFLILSVIGIRKWIIKRNFTFITKRNILLSYLGAIVFLSFLIIVFLLPKIESEAMGEARSIPDIYSMVLDGQSQDDLPKKFMKDMWTITPKSDVIYMSMENEYGVMYTNIVVEEHDDPNIEVTLYETPTLVGDIDISSEIPLNSIEIINDNEIFIDNDPIEVDVRFYNISNDMIYNQFTDSPNSNWKHEFFNFDVGEQLLYVTIPKGMIIESKIEDHIHYVND